MVQDIAGRFSADNAWNRIRYILGTHFIVTFIVLESKDIHVF